MNYYCSGGMTSGPPAEMKIVGSKPAMVRGFRSLHIYVKQCLCFKLTYKALLDLFEEIEFFLMSESGITSNKQLSSSLTKKLFVRFPD
jgi:hypothetical protein